MSKQKKIDQLQSKCDEMRRVFDLFPKLRRMLNDSREENAQLHENADYIQAKYEAVVAELKAAQGEIEHEIQRSEFYKGEFLRRKGNKVALDEFDDFKNKLAADAIRGAKLSIIDKWEVTKDHASVLGDNGYIYISNRALDEFANKLERSEL